MKIDNIESAIAAIESANFKVEKGKIKPWRVTWNLDTQLPAWCHDLLIGHTDQELIQTARKCQLKAFW